MLRSLICCWFSHKTTDITINEPDTTNTTNTTDQNVNKLSIITEESDDDDEIPYRTPSITKDKNLQNTNYGNNINRFL